MDSGADPAFPLGGAPTYDFVKFSKRLHEIEKILGRWGFGGGPLDPPMGLTSACSALIKYPQGGARTFYR